VFIVIKIMKMKRYIVIVENNKYKREDYKKLFKLLKNSLKEIKLNDVRIATKHIEIDLFSENLDFINYIKDFKIIEIRDLSLDINKDLFEFAKELFNKERFWEFHETLETVWRKSQGDERRILHGLILLSASFVHKQRGKENIGISILKRAYDELQPYENNYKNFNIGYIKNKIKEMLSNNCINEFTL